MNTQTGFAHCHASGRATRRTSPFADGAEMRPAHSIKSHVVLKCALARDSVAVEGRIPIEGLEHTLAFLKKILPTSADLKAIKSNFGILIGRVLKKHFKFFCEFGMGVVKHIKHEHYEEMSQKSEVVSV